MRDSLLAQLRALDAVVGDPPALSGIADDTAPTHRPHHRAPHRSVHRAVGPFAKGREGKGREGKKTLGAIRRWFRATSNVNRHARNARGRHVLTLGGSADA